MRYPTQMASDQDMMITHSLEYMYKHCQKEAAGKKEALQCLSFRNQIGLVSHNLAAQIFKQDMTLISCLLDKHSKADKCQGRNELMVPEYL